MENLHECDGRIAVTVTAEDMGDGIIVRMFNENAHIGSVAVGEYYAAGDRASCSVITRLGHKEHGVAARAAEKIAKETKRPVTVIAGIHIDRITASEIKTVVQMCDRLVDALIRTIGK